MITQQELKQIINYDPETGDLTWLVSRGNVSIGKKAGVKNGCGYIVIKINGKMYLAHRIIWLYVYGVWPCGIDHINHKPADNRLINLREATLLENQQNRSMQKNNTSGITGVFFNKRDGRWIAAIKIDSEKELRKTFIDKFEAICCRKSAEIKYNYHTNHGR